MAIYPTIQTELAELTAAGAEHEARSQRLPAMSAAEIAAHTARGEALTARARILKRRIGIWEGDGPQDVRSGGSLTARQAGRALAERWRRGT